MNIVVVGTCGCIQFIAAVAAVTVVIIHVSKWDRVCRIANKYVGGGCGGGQYWLVTAPQIYCYQQKVHLTSTNQMV